jgi:RNA polymerase sigma-70 factor (ECF subfamily)
MTEPARERPRENVSFRAVFESEFGYVWNTLRRLGVAERDAEDVAHDTFVVVHRRLGDYEPERPLRPWLFGIAYRTASDYRRLARHRHEVLDEPSDLELVDDGPDAEERLADAEARALFMRTLDALSLDRRAVLVMHDIDGHPIPEVAAALSIPLNTAYSRLRLAREDFHAELERARRREGR